MQKYDTTDDSSFPKRIRSTTLLTDEELVRHSVAEMKRLKMTCIRAHHIYPDTLPNRSHSYDPDATALYDECPVLLKAEMSSSLYSSQTSAQLKAFFLNASNSKGLLVLAVAKSDEQIAIELVRSLFGDANNAVVWAF